MVRFGPWMASFLFVSALIAVAVLPVVEAPNREPEGKAAPGVPSTLPMARRSIRLPLSFEANQGQADATVKFLARGADYKLYLGEDGMKLACARRRDEKSGREMATRRDVVRLSFAGSNRRAAISGSEELPGRVNYLIGDRAHWHTNVPLYARAGYKGLYPGIDLSYYGNGGNIENDFVVAPGADAHRISLRVTGATPRVSDRGDLRLDVSGGSFTFRRPDAYEIEAGKKVSIEAGYQVDGNRVRFQIGAYDHRQALIIDPVVIYSSYLGGDTAGDSGAAATSVAVDSSGDLYVAGVDDDSDFPMAGGAVNETRGGFISEIDPAGTSLIYSAIVAGSVNSMAIDTNGDVFAAVSAGTNFPTTAGAFQATSASSVGNPVIFELKAGGTEFLYATYLGGSSGSDVANAIAIDGSGDAYVARSTASTNFPVLNAIQAKLAGGSDGFITKLNPGGGGLAYSTYLGGSATDSFNAIAVDASGNAYVTGMTQSTFFPTMAPFQSTLKGLQNAVVVKLSAAGALEYSTFLGGNQTDAGYGITTDASSDAFVTGSTSSCDFPVTGQALEQTCPGNGDAFVTEFNATGGLDFSTYLGGSSSDAAYSIALDGSGNIYVGGLSASTNFPLANAVEPNGPGAFVSELNPAGSSLVFSTYLGPATYVGPGTGLTSQNAVAVAVDGSGNIYTAGSAKAGLPVISELPSVFTGGQSATTGGPLTAAFVTKIAAANDPAAGLTPTTISFGDQPEGTTSAAETVTVTNLGSSALTITSIMPTASFGETDNCVPGISAAGGTCTINVTFAPATTGAQSGSISIADNAAGSPQVVSLSGNGVVPAVVFSPPSLTFTSQPVGNPSQPQSITVTNVGSTKLTINQISSSAAFPETNNCGTTLGTSASGNPSNSCTVQVSFDPTASGTNTGTLTITDSAAGSPQTAALSGTGTPAAGVALSTTTLTFSNTVIGTTSTPQTVTVTNAGDLPLTFSSISVSGDFAQTNTCGAGVPAGDSCTISVVFSPKTTGTRSGLLTIKDNAPDSPQFVSLAGNINQSGLGMTINALSSSSSCVPGSTTNPSTCTADSAATVTAGQTATYTLSVIGNEGFTGSATITCTGLPTDATCGVSPNPVAVNGTFPVSFTTSVTTTAQSNTTTSTRLIPLPQRPGGGPIQMALVLSAFGLLIVLTASALRSPDDKRLGLAGLGGVALLLVVAAACGGGSSSTSTTSTVSGTPTGTYTITVTATSGASTGSIALTLNVDTNL